MKKSKSSPRAGRVGDLLQRELSKIIRDEYSDPKYGMLTISAVEVNNDLSLAKVFVTVLPDEKLKESLEVLNQSSGYIRSLVSKKVAIRSVPKMNFIYDESIKTGNRMNELLEQVKENTQDDPI